MGQQRVSNIALFNTEREYANSVVNNDADSTIDIFGRRNDHRYIWPSIWLFLLTCFMSSYDRFICKNIFTSYAGLYVSASYDHRFFSTVSLKYGQRARIFGQMVHRLPLARNCPYAYASYSRKMTV